MSPSSPETQALAVSAEVRLSDFPAVMDAMEQPLLRYACRLLRDDERSRDVVQEAFMRLIEHLRRDGCFSGQVRPWLYRVTHNLAMDVLRRAGREVTMDDAPEGDDEPHPRELGEMPAPDHARRDAGRLAWKFLSYLNERERQVVLLKVEEELSYQEIAEIVQTSAGNVGYILHHALKKLARALHEARAV